MLWYYIYYFIIYNIMKVKIIDIAYGGYGVAKPDNYNKVIFIPHSVDGDILDIEIIKEKKNIAFAEIKNILKPSEYRIIPECKYASICGGCAFNHIDYDKQLYFKKRILESSIRNIDYNNTIEIITQKESSRDYRLRVNILAREGKIGFYKFNTNDFVEIDDCIVLKKSLLEKIKQFVYSNNITANIYQVENEKNESLAFIELLEKTKNIDYSFFDGCTIKYKKSVKHYGLKNILYTTKYGDISISNQSFFQANRFLLDRFQDEAIRYIENNSSVVELYSGSGFFTSVIYSKTKNVISSEISDSALLGKQYNIKKESAFDTLHNYNNTLDCLFVDPPRDGLNKKVIKEILRIKPKSIIYISCNPMTFSRDIMILKDSYVLVDLKIIDMFVDTYHIELISFLKIKN